MQVVNCSLSIVGKGGGVIPPFLDQPSPFSKIPPFLEIQDVLTFHNFQNE